MYGDEVPKRPLGYEFGVKQSDVSGVRGLLRKQGFNGVENNTIALKKMEKVVGDLKQENKGLKCQADKNTELLGKLLEMISTGKAPTEFFNLAKTYLDSTKSKVSTPSNEEDAPNP